MTSVEIAMVASDPEQAIDRRIWQRSEGQYVYSELAEEIFPTISARAQYRMKSDLHSPYGALQRKLVYDAGALTNDTKISPTWGSAVFAQSVMINSFFELEEAADRSNKANKERWNQYGWHRDSLWDGHPDRTQGAHSHFTYNENTTSVLHEAVETSAIFPIKTLRILDILSEEKLVQSPEDVLRLLSTPEMSELMHDMAVAPNGFWASKLGMASTDPTIFFGKDDSDYHVFSFIKSTLSFIADTSSPLGFVLDTTEAHEALRTANRRGVNTKLVFDVGRLASTGCPVRSVNPSFTTPESAVYMRDLQEKFGLSEAAITQTREKSGIQLGLDCYNTILAAAIPYIVANNKTSQARMQKASSN